MLLPGFHVSSLFTLGIELEMQMVNPPGYDLSQDSSRLIDAVKPQFPTGEVEYDITGSMLEMATEVYRNIDHADAESPAMQQIIIRVAAEHRLAIRGGSTHPFQKWQRQEVCDDERYQRNPENFGYLIQQTTVSSQHVHVGCASDNDVIYLLHGLSRLVPYFITFSAVSPYMQTSDTRFACACLNTFSGFPDDGPMPWVNNWWEFEGLFRRLVYTSMADSIKDLYWDIRPSPYFSTAKVWVMDTPLVFDHAVNMAGLIQATAYWLLTKRLLKYHERDYLLYKFNRFQVCRFGMAGIVAGVNTSDGCRLSEDTL